MYSSKCDSCGDSYPSGTTCDCKDKDCVMPFSKVINLFKVNDKEFSSLDDAKKYQKEVILAKKTKEQEESMQEYKDYIKLIEYVNRFIDKRNKISSDESVSIDNQEIIFQLQFNGSIIENIDCNENEIVLWDYWNSDYPHKMYKTSKKQFLLKETTLDKELEILKEKLSIAKIETNITETKFNIENI